MPEKKVAVLGKFDLLSKFAIGLASIAPGTHTVEGNFTTLKHTKGPHRGRRSNYAMEADLQSSRVGEMGDEVAHIQAFDAAEQRTSSKRTISSS
ncbi:hypothetical protein PI125_g15002 [Phytophthora idaei]|nr:hypothetical protein PI125_g15002 [Phytophthora idaei]